MITVAAVAATAAPSGARAATVSVPFTEPATFQAAPGERNVVTFRVAGEGLIEISDSGAPLTAGDGCDDDGSGVIRCHSSLLVVNAGDGDDEVQNASAWPPGPSLRAFDEIHGGDGNDTLAGNAFGEAGDDTITTTRWTDVGDGGPGDDVLRATGEAHKLVGGEGNDRLLANEAFGSTGRFESYGDDGRVRLDGGDGNDVLVGSPQADVLVGGPGADAVAGGGIGGAGQDEIDGGDGDDLLVVGGDHVPERDPPRPAVGYQPSEHAPPPAGSVHGGAGADRVFGGPNRDVLDGGDGADDVDGAGGPDTLSGGDGADDLRGGDGNDGFDGGPGPDRIAGGAGALDGMNYHDEVRPVSIDLTRPGGDGPAGEDDTILPGMDEFWLTEGDDRFVAGKLPVHVLGGLGSDVLIGGAGEDDLDGDAGGDFDGPNLDYGGDRLVGHGGDDTLSGNVGSDVITGGPGDDVLGGGAAVGYYTGGAQRYPDEDVISGGPGDDRIGGGWRVDAGSGDDVVSVKDLKLRNSSRVIPLGRDGNARCGPGRDVAWADYYDGIALDCETLFEGAVSWRSLVPAADGRVIVTVRCAWDFSVACKGSSRLVRTPAQTFEQISPPVDLPTEPTTPHGCRRSRVNATLATGRFRVRAGRVDRITLRLGRHARRVLARAGCLTVRASFRLRDPHHREYEVTRTFALRAHHGHAVGAARARFSPNDRETLLVSRSLDGGFPNGASRNATIAGDYQLASQIAFESDATDIVRGDTNGVSDVFVVSRKRPYSIDAEPWRPGATRLVTRGVGARPANGPSSLPDLSGDRHHRPRCVVFISSASNLVRGDTNGVPDAFIEDLQTGRTTRVSVSSGGNQANAATTEVQVDGACKRVAFVSAAGNLVRGHGRRGVRQVYLREGGKTLLVSRSRRGTPGNGESSQVSLSRTAPALAYASNATNLAHGDHGHRSDVYASRITHGRPVTTLVSRTVGGRPGNGASDQPDIARGGEVVAFRTRASNLLARDRNRVADIAVAHTRRPGRFEFASHSEALGEAGSGPSSEPAAVEPGTNVFFSSDAYNLQPTARSSYFDRNRSGDVFFWSALSGNVSLQSRDSHNQILNNRTGNPREDADHVPAAPATNPAVSYYGNYLLFESPYPLIDLSIAAKRFPGLSAHDAAVMSNTEPALRQVYLRYIGPR